MKRPRRRPGAVGGALWGQMLRRSWGCKMQRQPDEALATPEREREHCPLELSSLGLKWWGLYILIRLSHWTQPAWERADPAGAVCGPHSRG